MVNKNNFESRFLDLCGRYGLINSETVQLKFDDPKIYGKFIRSLRALNGFEESPQYVQNIIVMIKDHLEMIESNDMVLDIFKIYLKLNYIDRELSQRISGWYDTTTESRRAKNAIKMLSMFTKIDMNNPVLLTQLISVIRSNIQVMNYKRLLNVFWTLFRVGVEDGDLNNEIISKLKESIKDMDNRDLSRFIMICNNVRSYNLEIVDNFIDEAVSRYNRYASTSQVQFPNNMKNVWLTCIMKDTIKLITDRSLSTQQIEKLFEFLYALDGKTRVNYGLSIRYRNKYMMSILDSLTTQ